MPTKTLPIRLLLVLGPKLGFLDKWGHRLRIPKFSQSPICDAWDWHLGVYDDMDELPLEHWTMGEFHGPEPDTGADCKD
jgi:hypothetical protein